MESSDERLERVFSDVLGVPRDACFESLSYRGIKQWDSIAHMQLVTRLEGEFSVMFDTDDVIGMSSYPIARQMLKRLGVEF